MTMDLDRRARAAAEGLTSTVADTELHLAVPPTARFPRRSFATGPVWALSAGALTAFVIMVGAWMFRPTVVADDLDTSTTTSSTIATSTSTTPPTTAAPTTLAVSPPVASTVTTLSPDVTPPAITIDTPVEGQVFEVKTITFGGQTEPGARVFGGPYEADVDAEGRWSIILVLSEGSNRATFEAVDAAGNRAAATVTVVYQPPVTETKPPKEEKPLAAFTANFTWGECDLVPPYDEYHGTGQPGSWIEVVSEYGVGETMVKEDGTWYVKVFFPEAPLGKVFPVKVKDQHGRSKIFEFVAVG